MDLTYEQALQELQTIVEDLESGAVTMDRLVEKINRATEIVKFCKDRLRNTEKDLENLLEKLE